MGYLPFKIVYISKSFWRLVPLKYFTNTLYLSATQETHHLEYINTQLLTFICQKNKLTFCINIIHFSKLHFNQSTKLKLSILSCPLITTKTFFVIYHLLKIHKSIKNALCFFNNLVVINFYKNP